MRYINFLFIIMIAAVVSAAGDTSLGGRLLSDDPKVREAALEEAARSDEKALGKAVSRMKEALPRGGLDQQLNAAAALVCMGRYAEPAVPELMAALPPRDLLSLYAAQSLANIKAAVPALAEAVGAAIQEPGLKSPPDGASTVPGLSEVRRSSDTTLAEESALVLARMGPAAKEALPVLVRAAVHGSGDLKIAASIALVEMGRPAGEWLASALGDTDVKKRSVAAGILSMMLPPPPETVGPLVAALGDPDAGIRVSAARALYNYMKGTPDCLPEGMVAALSRAVRDPDEDTRAWSFMALRETGPAAVQWLTGALKAPDPAARAEAALILAGMYEPPGETAAPVLEALEDTDSAVRKAAAKAVMIYAIAAPLSLPATAPLKMLKALRDTDPDVRLAAAAALKNYAGRIPESLPGGAARDLAEALKDGNADLRLAVVFTLGLLASESTRAMDALIGALSDGDPQVRNEAALYLGAQGPVSRRALSAMRKNLASGDCLVRVSAAQALLAIEPALEKNADITAAARTECPGLRSGSLDEVSTLPVALKEIETTGQRVTVEVKRAFIRSPKYDCGGQKETAENGAPASTAVPEIFFECPEKYATEQERRDAIVQFANDYQKAFPDSTVAELVEYRYKLLVSHSCDVTLKNLRSNGDAEH